MRHYGYIDYIGICKRYVYNSVVEKLSNKYSIEKKVEQIVEEVNKHFSLDKKLTDLVEKVYQSLVNKLKI